jgi:hypothetical protein
MGRLMLHEQRAPVLGGRKQGGNVMQFVSRVFWPAYLAACLAEIACFSLINPAELRVNGNPVDFSATAVYSIGFLAFVTVGVVSSVLTCYLSKTANEINRRVGTSDETVISKQ